MAALPLSLTKSASGVAACLLAATACAPAGGTAVDSASHALAPPAVVGFTPSMPVAPEDGLHHLIVTLAPSAVVDATDVSDVDGLDSRGVTADADGIFWDLDPSVMTSLPPGAELVFDEGSLRVRLPDGSIVEPTMPIVSLGHPTIDRLARIEGVEQVTPIGDGSFAVAVTDPALLDGLPLTVADDPLLVLTADPYERYQWTLDNSGHNLDGLAINPAPLLISGADIDGVEARPAATGAGVVVAVIDSGVDFSHPDLAAARWNNPNETCGNDLDDDGNGFVDDCYGWDFAYEDSTPFNPGAHAHGTHVAGIVAATAGNGIGIAGVAPDAVVMDLNVGVTTASGPSISTSSVARAIRYAVDNGADVINLSLGTPPGTPRSAMSTVEAAIAHAGAHGVIVVIAAGNDNVDLTSTPVWPASYEGDHIITVAASAPNETKASFSNYGGSADLFAPGHLILSTAPAANGSYLFMSGTSQAAPTVAGAAALVLQMHPSSSAGAASAMLIDSADRVQAYLPYVGAGVRLNAANAVGLNIPTVDLDRVTVTVDGLAGLSAGDQIAAELDIAVPAATYTEGYGWEASLYTLQGSDTYAVVGHNLFVDGSLQVTDERGAVVLGASGSAKATLTTQLPAGQYALVLEAVPDADPFSRLGEPFIAAFWVLDPTAPTTTAPPTATRPTTTTIAARGPVPSPPGATPPTTTSAPSDPSSPPPTTAAPTPPGPSGPPPTTTASPATTPPAAPVSTTTTSHPPAATSPTPTTTTASPTAPPSGPAPPAPTPTTTTTTGPTAPPAGASSGDWAIDSISPGSGPVSTYTAVQLRGTFPESVYVWFGDQPGIVGYQSATSLTVLTPLRQDSAVVDVTLRRSGQGTVLTLSDGFVFTNTSQPTAPPPSAPTPQPAVPTPTTPPPSPTTTAPSGPSSPSPPPSPPTAPTPSAPPTTGVEPPASSSSTTTTAAPFPSRSARGVFDSAQTQLGNGLRGVALQGSSPFERAVRCSTNPCSMG